MNPVLMMARARGMGEDASGPYVDPDVFTGQYGLPPPLPSASSSGRGLPTWAQFGLGIGQDVANIFRSIHAPQSYTPQYTPAQTGAAQQGANASNSSSNTPAASLSADSHGINLFGTRISWPTAALGVAAFMLIQHPGFSRRRNPELGRRRNPRRSRRR